MSDNTQSDMPGDGRPFRGRFMDMVHPSSDVKIIGKANSVATPSIEATSVVSDAPVADQTTSEFADNVIGEITDESLQSPFLPGIKVDKRPLGSAEEVEAKLPDWLQRGLDELSEPSLPADDGGGGETEPASPASIPRDNVPEEPALIVPSSAVESLPEKPRDMRGALANTMIQPQYQADTAAQIDRPSSPYAYASHDNLALPAKVKKHIPVWTWIIIYILLILAGGAVGALVYLSGWLG